MLNVELNVYSVVEKGGRFLVMRRKNGVWEFPGGGLEKGEVAERAAERETREECGLRVKAKRLLCTTSAVFGKKYALYAVYETELLSDPRDARISGEHAEMKWVGKKELGAMALGYNAKPVASIV